MSVISQQKTEDSPVSQRSSAATRSRTSTRARLLESGRSLFAKDGLHGVTTHDIARAAELASGTFYLHFSNKRELFREIVQTSVDELIEHIQTATADRVDVNEMVHAEAEAMVQFAEDHGEVMRMLFSADSDAAAVESDVLNQLATTIAEHRRERVAAGEENAGLDASVLGQALVGMWAQVLFWWSEDPSRVKREDLIRTLARIQLEGMHPKSE